MASLINKLLKPFGLKLLKTTDVFDWCGDEYHLPMKCKNDSVHYMVDKNNKVLPIIFGNEEDRNFAIRAVNRALANVL